MAPPADYLQPNFALAWIAGRLGFLSATSYFTFHLIVTVIAVMLPFWMPVVRRQTQSARLLFLVIAGGPVAGLLVVWSNGYDALTVIGISVGALARRPWFAAAGWLVAGFNHPLIGGLSFLAWASVVLFEGRTKERMWRVVAGAAAVSAGWWSNEQLMLSWGGYTSRAEWRELVGLGGFWDLLWPAMPLVLFGSVGVAWLIMLHPDSRNQWWIRLLIVEALVIPIVVSGLTLDSTRVAALILFAPVLFSVSRLGDHLAGPVTQGMWRWWVTAAVIVPIPLIFSGELYYLGWGAFEALDAALKPPEGYELVQ
jgi:hypothetical protein